MIFIKWPAGRYTGRQKYQATHLFYTQVVVSSEKSRMDKTLLSQYFPTQGHLPESFARLFEHLEELSNVFYAIIVEDKGIYKYAYASPSIEKITGHEIARFSYDEGWAFFYSITPPEERVLIQQQEAYYFNKMRQPDFDTTKPFFMEINGTLECHDKQRIRLRLLTDVLKFNAQRVPQLAIGVWQYADGVAEEEVMLTRFEIEFVLGGINMLYGGTPVDRNHSHVQADGPVRLSYPGTDFEELTRQECRILKLIADGNSTDQIANTIHVSVNTVETHRKHLLQKFHAANVAEMIKKATKLYWLE